MNEYRHSLQQSNKIVTISRASLTQWYRGGERVGVYSPLQHWHRVEGALAELGEDGTSVRADNTSVSLDWVMADTGAEGEQSTVQ